MPHEKKLGFDRDGNVYVKEYLTHLGLYWDGKLDILKISNISSRYLEEWPNV